MSKHTLNTRLFGVFFCFTQIIIYNYLNFKKNMLKCNETKPSEVYFKMGEGFRNI